MSDNRSLSPAPTRWSFGYFDYGLRLLSAVSLGAIVLIVGVAALLIGVGESALVGTLWAAGASLLFGAVGIAAVKVRRRFGVLIDQVSRTITFRFWSGEVVVPFEEVDFLIPPRPRSPLPLSVLFQHRGGPWRAAPLLQQGVFIKPRQLNRFVELLDELEIRWSSRGLEHDGPAART